MSAGSPRPSIWAHRERHLSGRTGWLRAFVLGANDAIVSIASLMLGVAASSASRRAVLVAGVSGLVGGAMSMAAGEFVSVSSQRDAELAEMAREKRELDEDPDAELRELTTIYMRRGLDNALAARVAKALSAGDRLGAHLRDELGFDPHSTAQPFQAACASAISFAFFASIPIVALLLSPTSLRIPVISIVSLVSLVSLGAFGAHLGGAPWKRAVVRVCLGGILAMGTTAVLGRLVGAG